MAPDPTELERMIAGHGDRLYGYAYYLLGRREEAEDVVQEAFLRLWRRGTAEPPRRLEAWLLRVAHNLCIDARRRSRSSGRYLRVLEPVELANLPASTTAPDPARQLELAEDRRTLVAALGDLSPAARSVVVMHYLLEMPVKEIACTVGASESAIKLRLHRARKVLRGVLAGDADDIVTGETGDADEAGEKAKAAGGQT